LAELPWETFWVLLWVDSSWRRWNLTLEYPSSTPTCNVIPPGRFSYRCQTARCLWTPMLRSLETKRYEAQWKLCCQELPSGEWLRFIGRILRLLPTPLPFAVLNGFDAAFAKYFNQTICLQMLSFIEVILNSDWNPNFSFVNSASIPSDTFKDKRIRTRL